jgi:hypothetical protein
MKLSSFKQSYAQRRKATLRQAKAEDFPATTSELSQNLERICTSLQPPADRTEHEERILNSISRDSGLVQADKLNITTLPTEILLRIFHYLRPPNSVLFGLTCRRLYKLHWSIHGKVKLKVYVLSPGSLLWLTTRRNDDYIISDPKVWEWLLLYHYLQQWMGPQYTFDARQGILIKTKNLPRWLAAQARRRGENWRKHFEGVYVGYSVEV